MQPRPLVRVVCTQPSTVPQTVFVQHVQSQQAAEQGSRTSPSGRTAPALVAVQQRVIQVVYPVQTVLRTQHRQPPTSIQLQDCGEDTHPVQVMHVLHVQQPTSPTYISSPAGLQPNTQPLETQVSRSAFKRGLDAVLDIEPIRPLLHEFELGSKRRSTRKQLFLLYSLFKIYILSLIDVISDLLLLFQASRGNGCIATIWSHPDTIAEFYVALAFLWVSTLSAIFNTVVFKYCYALIAMKRHKLTFWNAMKYVGMYTHLKTSVSHASCCNRHQWTRIVITILEDLIQVIVGTRFFLSLRRRDFITEFSIYTSLLALVFVFASSVFWLMRDCIRCVCQPCCVIKREWGSRWCRLCFVCPFALFAILLMVTTLSGLTSTSKNELWDRGFQVADIVYSIDYIRIPLNDRVLFVDGHGYSRYYFELSNTSFSQSFRATDSQYDSLQQCVDQTGYAFAWDQNTQPAHYPLLCFKIVDSRIFLTLKGKYEYFGGYEYFEQDVFFNLKQEINSEVDTMYALTEDDFEVCDGLCMDTLDSPYDVIGSYGNISLYIDYTWVYFVNCED